MKIKTFFLQIAKGFMIGVKALTKGIRNALYYPFGNASGCGIVALSGLMLVAVLGMVLPSTAASIALILILGGISIAQIFKFMHYMSSTEIPNDFEYFKVILKPFDKFTELCESKIKKLGNNIENSKSCNGIINEMNLDNENRIQELTEQITEKENELESNKTMTKSNKSLIRQMIKERIALINAGKRKLIDSQFADEEIEQSL